MKPIKTVDKTKAKQNIKVAFFDGKKRKTEPHKHHNYLEVILLFDSSGEHVIDNETYQVNQPTAFTVRKGQVHFWNLAPNPVGIVILIKNTFIDQVEDPVIKNLLHQLAFHQCLLPSEITTLNPLANLLVDAFDRPNSVNYREGLLKAFLSDLLHHSKDFSPRPVSRNFTYKALLDLVHSKSIPSIKVADYAEALNTTPQNLTQICQKEQNQSASEIIATAIISEAVRLLHYSDNNISEIAIDLGFKDTSHFIKYFKKHKAITPNQFRLRKL